MTVTQRDKAIRFQELHRGPGAFAVPNPWDASSARILSGLGFQALATSSGAFAATLGLRDGQVTRGQTLALARTIVEATDLPVSADLENGFGDSPESAAETIRLAAGAGLAGGSIEDAPGAGGQGRVLYDITLAAERVSAAAEAARALPFPFVLTARTENYACPDPSLDETIERLQAFEKAGADVLFAPALPDLDSVRAVCSSVSKPVNFMVGMRGRSFSIAELEAAGVRRISFAVTLYGAAMSALLSAAQEIRERGTFDYLDRVRPMQELLSVMRSVTGVL